MSETLPVEPRPAASLIVRRGEGDATTLLMGRRGAHHRFMPNVLVFPGGAVDAEDYGAPVASPLGEEVMARLTRSATPALAAALAVAACRELAEEVGLSLGAPPRLAGLDYVCRAITPPDRSIRFDARFFTVDAAEVEGEPASSAELDAPGWYRIEAALAEDLALATRAVLLCFQDWLAGKHRDRVPVLEHRAWREE